MLLRQWEEDWMNQKAEAANVAADTGQSGTLFQTIKDFIQVKEHRRSFRFRRDANPQEEAEARKEHFAQIQAGVLVTYRPKYGKMSTLNLLPQIGSPPRQHLQKVRKLSMTQVMTEPPARTHLIYGRIFQVWGSSPES